MELVVQAIMFIVVAQRTEKGRKNIDGCQVELADDSVRCVKAEVSHLRNVKTVYVIMVCYVKVSVALPNLNQNRIE